MSSATEQSPESGTEIEREIGHDDFDPIGTLLLVAMYFVIIGLLWIFTYFIEFLGRGPTVV
jgi:hypothetical protein